MFDNKKILKCFVTPGLKNKLQGAVAVPRLISKRKTTRLICKSHHGKFYYRSVRLHMFTLAELPEFFLKKPFMRTLMTSISFRCAAVMASANASHSLRLCPSAKEERALAGRMTQNLPLQPVCSHFNPFFKNNCD